MDIEMPPTETIPDQAIVTVRETTTSPQPEETPEPEPPYRLQWQEFRKKKQEEHAQQQQAGITSFEQILEAHQQWIKGSMKPKKPECADLSGWDLRGRTLTNINLRGATLKGAILSHCDLTETDFTEADLSGADFTGSKLRNTKFHNANLEDATLTDVKDLTAQQIGGANLEGIVPANAVTIDGTGYVDECLKNAGKLYVLLQAICAFCILTILSTKAPAIILSNGEAKLPVVDMMLPTPYFFWIAPLVVLLTHFALHLQLFRGWEAMTKDLPAVFPDGKTVERKVHPLMLNAIALRHWKQLKDKHPPFHWGQAFGTGLTAYCTAPITILLFWDRYLVSGVLKAAQWHLLLLTLAMWTGRSLRQFYVAEVQRVDWRGVISNPDSIFSHLPIFVTPLILLMVSDPTPAGGLRVFWSNERMDLRNALPKPKEWIERPVFDRTSNDEKTRADWAKYDHQVALWQGISLEFRHLENAQIQGGFLVGADLMGTHLEGANLSMANLARAGFTSTNLKKAILWGADLTDASLMMQTDLSSADLWGADLTNATVTEVDLTNANLTKANLTNASLSQTNLTNTNLWGADLSGADLTQVKNLEKAKNVLLAKNLDKAKLSGIDSFLLTRWKQAAEERKKLGIE